MLTQLQAWWDFLNDAQAITTWHRDHAEIPIIAVSLYLVFIFGVPSLMKNRKEFNLKTAFTIWNLLLSSWYYSFCETSENWYNTAPHGVWVMLFVYSKFPELVDTVFLVLRKREVIFLHWFHHVTVLLYCWHAYHHSVAAGLWFATMNYSVHSIMYLYYFMMNAGFYSLVRPIAPFITAIQILQMVGGLFVLSSVAWNLEVEGNACDMDRANYKLGLLMYLSYFILFAILFWDKYIAAKPANKGAKPSQRCIESVGCVDESSKMDASGMFRPEEEGNKKLKTK